MKRIDAVVAGLCAIAFLTDWLINRHDAPGILFYAGLLTAAFWITERIINE